jgi:hypothetical protein
MRLSRLCVDGQQTSIEELLQCTGSTHYKDEMDSCRWRRWPMHQTAHDGDERHDARAAAHK